jgi:Domain of unknown function (DUF4349)
VEVLVKNVKTVIALLAVVVVVSCNKAGPSAEVTSADQASQAPAMNKSVAAPIVRAPDAAGRLDGAAMGLAATAEAPAVDRMIVRSAQMRIVVGDTTKTVDAVTKAVEAMGGFVAGSNIWRDGELMRATLTLRIPADKLTATLSSIRGLARRVESETIASQDVSQEYVDLASNVRNLEATETELRELLIVARKNSRKAADVLEVHEQLTLIRGQIEQAKGRMRYLTEVASLSSIALEVAPDAITKPVVEPGWQPFAIAKDAVRALIASLQSVATVAIWLLVYVVPVFGMLALVILALWKIARRSRVGNREEVHE